MIEKFKQYFDKVTTITDEVKKIIHDLLWGTIVIVSLAAGMYTLYRVVELIML